MRFPLLLCAICIISAFCGSCSKKKEKTPGDSIVVYSEFHDFESVLDPRTDSVKTFSGKKSGLLNHKTEYGFGLEKQVKNIPSYNSINEIDVSFKCYMIKPDSSATFVFSVDDTASRKNILWEGKEIKPASYGKWDNVTIRFKVSKKLMEPEHILKLYIWNKEKSTFYFDDISFSFIHKKR